MLARQMRRLGAFLVPLAIVAWILFAAVFVIDFDEIPAPVRWLAVVVALASTLAATVGLYLRARNRSAARNTGL